MTNDPRDVGAARRAHDERFPSNIFSAGGIFEKGLIQAARYAREAAEARKVGGVDPDVLAAQKIAAVPDQEGVDSMTEPEPGFVPLYERLEGVFARLREANADVEDFAETHGCCHLNPDTLPAISEAVGLILEAVATLQDVEARG